MKEKNKIDLLESLLSELEQKDIDLLQYTYVTSGIVEAMQKIIKAHEDINSQNMYSMVLAFQLGYIMSKREERLKHKNIKNHTDTI